MGQVESTVLIRFFFTLYRLKGSQTRRFQAMGLSTEFNLYSPPTEKDAKVCARRARKNSAAAS
jgi:hypothetical protein